jgi:hydroxyacylglutathione hydrolase
MQVIPIAQLSDNYAYLVIDEATKKAGIVDCAEAQPVLQAVAQQSLDLVAILPTHHHLDHVGGNNDLLEQQPDLEVYGYAGEGHRIPGCTREVNEGDVVRVGNLEATILFIPAHTSGHVAYYFEREAAVFTGDTLFAGGCGRLFEGDAGQMMKSLAKLMALPDDTRVYFGHDARKRQPTAPTTIASEKETNPFFRWRSDELRASVARAAGKELDDVGVFAKTRALKDEF